MKDFGRLANAKIYNAEIQYPRISYDNDKNDFVFEVSFNVSIDGKIKYAQDSLSLNLEVAGGGTALKKFMFVLGVNNFKDIAKQYVRIAYNIDGKIKAIGHILGNDWFFIDNWFSVKDKQNVVDKT